MNSVIIISDSYHPEKTSCAKLLKDLTDELLKRNKRVTILTTGKENQFVRDRLSKSLNWKLNYYSKTAKL